jgi:CRP/FNR family cyclic AMP-dependent transcriptional regulator
VDPDLGDGCAQHQDLSVQVRTLAPGRWEGPERDGLGSLIVHGLVAQRVRLAGQRSVTLAWEGDLISCWPTEPSWLEHAPRWQVLEPTVVAELDAEFLQSVHGAPAVLVALTERMRRLQARASLSVAIAHLSRVEDRILTAMLLLAEERGRATVDGLVVRVPLTHERLGEIVGARRPTVSLALRDLDSSGLVRRGPDGQWIIAPAAIDALRAMEDPEPANRVEARRQVRLDGPSPP